jgi:hypothetical protein
MSWVGCQPGDPESILMRRITEMVEGRIAIEVFWPRVPF